MLKAGMLSIFLCNYVRWIYFTKVFIGTTLRKCAAGDGGAGAKERGIVEGRCVEILEAW